MLGLLTFTLVIFTLACLISFLTRTSQQGEATLVDEVNAVLPQTQCGQCGYPGCKPYAEAIINDSAPINQCPPGGQAGVKALADLLNLDEIPLNAENGTEKPPRVAVIDENACIGCTLCIQACPVDAILGASKRMHTVIADECTGCELCVPPCPVDCIDMIETPSTVKTWHFPLSQKIPVRKPQ